MAFFYLDSWTETLIDVARWPILMVAILTGISLIYRFGPSREHAKWRWLSWGAVLATLVWLAASWLFSFYLQNFADYNATYGSLGAVVGLMMWTWISVIILIVGAAVNAEMEHQTALRLHHRRAAADGHARCLCRRHAWESPPTESGLRPGLTVVMLGLRPSADELDADLVIAAPAHHAIIGDALDCDVKLKGVWHDGVQAAPSVRRLARFGCA